MQMARSRALPIKGEYFWHLANQEAVILPSLERKLRENALCLSQSAINNFALHVINRLNPVDPRVVDFTWKEPTSVTTDYIPHTHFSAVTNKTWLQVKHHMFQLLTRL